MTCGWETTGETGPKFSLFVYFQFNSFFRYSRHHLTLDAGRDKDFWQFTWDEMAKYDLPAELNYVLDKTGKEKIFYIGHSMGTTTYMVMNSLDQSWADKVELAVFLAPVAYVDHMNSPIRMLTHGLGLVLVRIVLSCS